MMTNQLKSDLAKSDLARAISLLSHLLSHLIFELYILALSALYWLSLRLPQMISFVITAVMFTASSTAPHALSIRDSHAAAHSLQPARCWVGVIDQINPPWISVTGERGEAVEVSLDHAYPEAREGDWVLYWTRAQTLEPIRSPEVSRMRERLKRELIELSHEPLTELAL